MLGDDHFDKVTNNVNNLSTIFNEIHLANLSIIISKNNLVKVA